MTTQYASQMGSGYQNHLRKIAIVGAGGQVGSYIVDALLQSKKFEVTALSRPNSTNTFAHGITVKRIDYDSTESLTSALKGQDALIITMGVMALKEQQLRLIEAAATADVQWILPNEFGFDRSDEKLSQDLSFLVKPKVEAQQKIEALGKSNWIGMASGFWYEYSLSLGNAFGIDITNRKALLYDDGNSKINTSTWPQCGRAVAHLLQLKILPDDENDTSPTLSQFKNQFCRFASFNVSQQDMLDSVIRVTGSDKGDWQVPTRPVREYFEENLKLMQTGDRAAYMKALYSRNFYPDMNQNTFDHGGRHNKVLQLPEEDLDEYTKKAVHRAAELQTS